MYRIKLYRRELYRKRKKKEKIEKTNKNVNSVGVWKMFFDGASSWEGAGAGVLFVAPRDEFIIPFSYRLQWDIDYTNNVCEYEALVLGLEAARKLKIENLIVYGDGHIRWSREGKEPVQLSSFLGFRRSQLGVSRPFNTGLPKCEM
jgi:hypothetical protein